MCNILGCRNTTVLTEALHWLCLLRLIKKRKKFQKSLNYKTVFFNLYLSNSYQLLFRFFFGLPVFEKNCFFQLQTQDYFRLYSCDFLNVTRISSGMTTVLYHILCISYCLMSNMWYYFQIHCVLFNEEIKTISQTLLHKVLHYSQYSHFLNTIIS
jgi:hypothetical protein